MQQEISGERDWEQIARNLAWASACAIAQKDHVVLKDAKKWPLYLDLYAEMLINLNEGPGNILSSYFKIAEDKIAEDKIAEDKIAADKKAADL